MKPSGSSYIGSHGEDFVTTNDLAWVGFSVEIGPDGGVYILDWHDTDICGNKINFPKSGRIYRLMPKGAKRIARPNVGALADSELVAMQEHTNDWYVRQARLQLQMRAAGGKLTPETPDLVAGDVYGFENLARSASGRSGHSTCRDIRASPSCLSFSTTKTNTCARLPYSF